MDILSNPSSASCNRIHLIQTSINDSFFYQRQNVFILIGYRDRRPQYAEGKWITLTATLLKFDKVWKKLR